MRLIHAQADRCRDILRAMGPGGKEDARFAPVSSVLAEAAAPHACRGRRIVTRNAGETAPAAPLGQPEIERRPEIIQGLRNLVQKAVDFAGATIWIDVDWTAADDGPGYPADLIGRIGEPYLRRRALQSERPGDDGSGSSSPRRSSSAAGRG